MEVSNRSDRDPEGRLDDIEGMVLVPPGEFLMGTGDAEARELERRFSSAEFAGFPQHQVWVDAFYLDLHPVTNAQYMEFVEATGHRPPVGEASLYSEAGGVGLLRTRNVADFTPWGHPDFSHPSQPVVCVSWEDAVAYSEWAGKRLPTEAEWEKAARGTDGRCYPWGDELPYQGESDRANGWLVLAGFPAAAHLGHKYLAPVGSYPQGASPYGVMDMAGNVWEWVQDWYDAEYYESSPGRNPQGPGTGVARVIRGGSWLDLPIYLRCATRTPRLSGKGSATIGFRCARSL